MQDVNNVNKTKIMSTAVRPVKTTHKIHWKADWKNTAYDI